eukprot:5939400-Prymnesium_polylepis.2
MIATHCGFIVASLSPHMTVAAPDRAHQVRAFEEEFAGTAGRRDVAETAAANRSRCNTLQADGGRSRCNTAASAAASAAARARCNTAPSVAGVGAAGSSEAARETPTVPT